MNEVLFSVVLSPPTNTSNSPDSDSYFMSFVQKRSCSSASVNLTVFSSPAERYIF